ncbi:MAG TPA: RIP metalloprotease RseP [Blastocatellia bacterium]|nr:RIP metalloprotease RseP [Blastocatellia bacterium]
MQFILTFIIPFAIVLGAMIVIHEFGHFIVAKWCGVRVEVFSVGFGKRLWGIKKGDTDYRISLIPLGGYVKMAGENLDSEATGAPDEFLSKPKWQRFCIAIAGPGANILTALAIPATMLMLPHEKPSYPEKPALIRAVDLDSPAERAGLKPGDLIVKIDGRENPLWRDVEDYVALHNDQDVALTVKRGERTIEAIVHLSSRTFDQERIGYSGVSPTQLVVLSVNPDSPAAEAGLQPGDQLIRVNGEPVDQRFVGWDQVVAAVQGSNGNPVSLTVSRDGHVQEVRGTPRLEGGRLLLGFTKDYPGLDLVTVKLGPLDALRHSVDENLRYLKLTKTALGQVLTGKRSARDTLSGPVGIAYYVGQAAKEGAGPVLQMTAMLSLNLGVFNLLPIPVLDGGLILMLFLEAVFGLFGRRVSLRLKERMMQVGLVMLMLLMGFVIYNDIAKRVSSGTPAAQPVEKAEPAQNK